MQPLISVIIPVYNGEKSLRTCLLSVLRQTCQNIEILLIDDGSRDGSRKICEEFAGKDSRIRFLHQANAGAGAARNRGLALSRGQYVCFVDADDYIKEDYLEKLLEEILRDDADMLLSDPILVDEKGEERQLFWYPRYSCVQDRGGYYELALRMRSGMQLIPPWGKLIRSSLAKGARFPPMRFCEDALYILRLLEKEPRLAVCPYAGYCHVDNEESLTRSVSLYDVGRVHNSLVLNREIYRRYRQAGRDVEREVSRKYAEHIQYYLLTLVRADARERYQREQESLGRECRRTFRSGGLGMKTWLLLHMFVLSPDLWQRSVGLLVRRPDRRGRKG